MICFLLDEIFFSRDHRDLFPACDLVKLPYDSKDQGKTGLKVTAGKQKPAGLLYAMSSVQATVGTCFMVLGSAGSRYLVPKFLDAALPYFLVWSTLQSEDWIGKLLVMKGMCVCGETHADIPKHSKLPRQKKREFMQCQKSSSVGVGVNIHQGVSLLVSVFSRRIEIVWLEGAGS